jgi:hypothetical protein
MREVSGSTRSAAGRFASSFLLRNGQQSEAHHSTNPLAMLDQVDFEERCLADVKRGLNNRTEETEGEKLQKNLTKSNLMFLMCLKKIRTLVQTILQLVRRHERLERR